MIFRNFISNDPWREMNRIQREMNRLFNNVATPESVAYPAVNVWSNAEQVQLTAELPGYDPKDIQLSILNNELVISGNRIPEKISQDDKYHRQERLSGRFERTLPLPFMVDESKVEAKYEKGILSVYLQRAEVDKPKRIAIKTK